MKTRFLTLGILIVLTTIIMNSCSFLRGTGSTSNNNSICSNYENSEKSQLEVALIHEMTDLYQRSSNNTDAKAVWLDLETLKTFLYHLEMEAKKKNVLSEDLGVRIYYARYPDKTTWTGTGVFSNDLSRFPMNPMTNQYEMLHTVVMIPTKKIGTIHHDFNLIDVSTFDYGLTTAYDDSNEEYDGGQPMYVLRIADPDNYNAQNHGGLYPPYPDTGMDF